MADVRRILGTLPDGVDQHATADGRGKSVEESVARLARIFGCDSADGTLEDWRASAASIRQAQLESILDGCREVLRATPLPAEAQIIAAGIGAYEVAAIAVGLQRKCLTFGELAGATACPIAVTSCAPAVAVALLLPSNAGE
jgi:uncharacterized hydantoinase/oxoprolinase family protein